MAIYTTAADTSTNKDLYKVGSLRKLFDDTLKAIPQYYKVLYNDLKTKLQTERDMQDGGFEPATETVEGQNIPLQSTVHGNQKEYTQRIWSTGFRMTHMANRYNQYNLWADRTKKIARAQKVAKDVELHVPFNSPTSTSLTCGTGFDSLALASNTHTGLLAGSTSDNFDNYLNVVPSYAALESLRYYFKTKLDIMGSHAGGKATHIVFEPTLYPTMREMFGSSGKAWEDTNTVNWAGELGLKLVEDPRLTATTRWFALEKGEGYDINVFTGMNPIMYQKDAPDRTLDKVVMSQQHFSYGWGSASNFLLGQ